MDIVKCDGEVITCNHVSVLIGEKHLLVDDKLLVPLMEIVCINSDSKDKEVK